MSSSTVDVAERGFLGALSGRDHDVGSASARAGAFSDLRATEDDRGDAPSLRRLWSRQPWANSALAWIEVGWPLVHGAVARSASLELARGTALNFVPVFLAVGALGYFFASAEPPWSMLVLAVASFGIAAFCLGRWLTLRLLLAALFCIALGALFAKTETFRAGTKMMGGEIVTRLTGRIVATDHLASGRVRLTLDVVSTERPKLRYAPDRVRISARTVPPETRAGDLVTGVARLLPPLGATRPGGYDFAFESYFDGIGATGFFLGTPEHVAADGGSGPANRFLAAVENTRDRLATRIRDQVGGAEGEIAAALIAGVRAGIPEDVNEALRRTGLAHILSISGLHMALVAATIMGAMRLGFACFPTFASRHPVRKYAALVALAALAAYLFISGYQVAAQRSFIMIAIMLTALVFDRAALTMRNLALAAIIVLAVSPHEVVGPSFQMSFAATAALIGAYGAWSHRRTVAVPFAGSKHPATRLARLALFYVAGLAATSLLAGAATAIFGAYHFQRVSPLGLIANLAAMPVVSLLVMPFAVLGLVAMPFGLDGPAFAVMGEGLRLMLVIAEWFSERSPLDAVGLIAPGAVICLTIALLLATLLTTRLRLCALPFGLAGLTLCLFPPEPRMFVADDGRLVALRTADGKMSVNRSRPNGFALQSWSRAAASEEVMRPLIAVDAEIGASLDGHYAVAARFHCATTTCIAHTEDLRVITTPDQAMGRRACGIADVLVLDDATVRDICADTNTLVVTRRDLARRGSMMMLSDGRARFAIAEPYRPWHDHRRFSREARGLAPWKPGSSGPKNRPAVPDGPATGPPGPAMSRSSNAPPHGRLQDPAASGNIPAPDG